MLTFHDIQKIEFTPVRKHMTNFASRTLRLIGKDGAVYINLHAETMKNLIPVMEDGGDE